MAASGFGFGSKALDAPLIAHIEFERNGTPAKRLYFRREGAEMIAMAAGDDHISAGFGESTSERLAQAAACAGHDGNAAAKMEEFAHEKLPGRRTTFMRLGSRA